MDQEKLVRIFHEFHRHPELSHREYETTNRIRRLLSGMPGIEIRSLGLPTGLYGILSGDPAGPVIAVRSDIDALPVTEPESHSPRSENEGVMHACGHDFHMTAVLGAASLLAADSRPLPGSVIFLFQPAEETSHGASEVIETGFLEKEQVREIFGLHTEPALPAGKISMRDGPFSASCDRFVIRISGRGGHGSHPDETLDPIPAAARLITSLQEIMSRTVSPMDAGVVSITRVAGGSGWNIIPDSCELEGTVRTFRAPVREHIFRQMAARTKALDAEGYETRLLRDRGCAASDNDPRLMRLIRSDAKRAGIPVCEYPLSMIGDDFADYETRIPGGFFQVGVGPTAPLHSPDYVADPAGLSMTARLLADVLRDELGFLSGQASSAAEKTGE